MKLNGSDEEIFSSMPPKFKEISPFFTFIEDSEGNPMIEYLPHFMSTSADSKK